jgi:hypothetical protein
MALRSISILSTILSTACLMESSINAIEKPYKSTDTGFEVEMDTEIEDDNQQDDSEVPESNHEMETEEEEETEQEMEPPPEDDCTETSDLIYTVDKNTQNMYLFDPNSSSFSMLGALPCDDWGWEGDPGSMGVSRNGYAYVRYSGGLLYEVDVTDLSCEESNFSSHNFGAYGMGYATDHGNTWQDQLYIANSDTVASLNVQTGQYTTIGYMPSQSELTGNANGELWAFLPLEQPAKLVQLDKNNGNIVESISINSFSLQDLDTFAFAYWGGDFYLFVRLYGQSTNVYKVERNGTQTLVLEDSGLNIVGAGVSTCAPTE